MDRLENNNKSVASNHKMNIEMCDQECEMMNETIGIGVSFFFRLGNHSIGINCPFQFLFYLFYSHIHEQKDNDPLYSYSLHILYFRNTFIK